MIPQIKGKTIKLYTKGTASVDPFGKVTNEEIPVMVENVLIEPASNDEIVNEIQLSGKRVAYVLHIPKGDTHDWLDAKVEFNGKTWKTIADCLEYDEEMTPLSWNKKVKVERYG